MELNGLVLGIEISNKCSQICYYDTTSNTAESIPFIGSTVILENPVSMDEMIANAPEGMPIDMDELVSLIAFNIETARKYRKCNTVSEICVTVDDFNITFLDMLKNAFYRLGYNRNIKFISHEECYAYYAYSQKKELWNGGVLLLDYGIDKLQCYMLSNINVKGTDIILEEYNEFDNEDLKDVITGEKTLRDVDLVLADIAKQLLNGKVIASVYLTGPGFDTEQLPAAFLQMICNRRRVFAGQNLYVKGACYCAYEQMFPTRFADTIFACNNRITTGIEVGIVERGMDKVFRVVKSGINWYDAGRVIDFIVDDCDSIVLKMIPAAGREPYEEVIQLSEFPYRSGKMTRISVEFQFTAHDRCMISVKDKGFGEFAKSSGKIIYKDIEL